MPNLVIHVFNLIQQYLPQERMFFPSQSSPVPCSPIVTKTSQAKYDAREYWPCAFFALDWVTGSLPVIDYTIFCVFNYQTLSRSSLKMLKVQL